MFIKKCDRKRNGQEFQMNKSPILFCFVYSFEAQNEFIGKKWRQVVGIRKTRKRLVNFIITKTRDQEDQKALKQSKYPSFSRWTSSKVPLEVQFVTSASRREERNTKRALKQPRDIQYFLHQDENKLPNL